MRFFAGHKDGRRSPSTWRVWTTEAGDAYIASRHLAGMVKTSLHDSGVCQTSFVDRGAVVPWADLDSPTRHLDRWARPTSLLPGIIHAFMIVFPESELVAWRETKVEKDAVRLPVALACGSAVDVFILEPTIFKPEALRIPDSVIFARLSAGPSREVVLVSRKLPWTVTDQALLTEKKAASRGSPRTITDPRPAKPVTPDMRHATRMTMFGNSEDGLRYVVDAWADRPLP